MIFLSQHGTVSGVSVSQFNKYCVVYCPLKMKISGLWLHVSGGEEAPLDQWDNLMV